MAPPLLFFLLLFAYTIPKEETVTTPRCSGAICALVVHLFLEDRLSFFKEILIHRFFFFSIVSMFTFG